VLGGKEIVEFGGQLAAIVAAVMIVTQFVKKGIEWIERTADEDSWIGKVAAWFAHGWGPKIISTVNSAIGLVLVYGPQIADIVADGKLTADELVLVLGWFGVTVSANFAYLATRLVAFTKEK